MNIKSILKSDSLSKVAINLINRQLPEFNDLVNADSRHNHGAGSTHVLRAAHPHLSDCGGTRRPSDCLGGGHHPHRRGRGRGRGDGGQSGSI